MKKRNGKNTENEYLHHYLECGLDNVYIVIENRFDVEGNRIIAIPAITTLHNAIAESIIKNPGLLTGKEIKFLRTRMRMTQSDLAVLLHRESQTIARWEKDQIPIDQSLDILIRQLVAEKIGIDLKKTITELSCERIGENPMKPLKLTHRTDGRKSRFTIDTEFAVA